MKEKNPHTDNYDNSWKDILDEFLPWFLKLFFPEIHEDINWNKGFESLDKELGQIANHSTVGRRIVDKLIKVHLKCGYEVCVYIHLEVQSQKQSKIAERMYIYNSLLYLQYKAPIMSLLVLGDDQPNWRPKQFEYELWGSKLLLKFQTVKLLDYSNRIEELKESNNPFALFVIAHIKTLQSSKNPNQRLDYKESIFKYLLEKDFSKKTVYLLFKFIDILMALPQDLEKKFLNNIYKYQEEKKVPILAPFEQIAQEKGIQIGEERGIQIGEERGSIKEAQVTIIDILNEEFGEIPPSLIKSINSIDDLPSLRKLRKDALRVDSLKEFKQHMKECKKQEIL